MSVSDFAASGGPRSKRTKVFVALRFTFPESRRFFQELQRAIRAHPLLGQVKLLSGDCPKGQDWAKTIRDRIKKCRHLAVGDVSHLRGDVLFELGMAYGLKRSIIPVVETVEQVDACPFWLRFLNIGTYETEAELAVVVDSIVDHLYQRAESPKPSLPDPVPSRAVQLGIPEWNRSLLDSIASIYDKEAIRTHRIERIHNTNYEEALEAVARSCYVVISCDDSPEDAFAHFACGVAMGKSLVVGSPALHRRIMVLRKDGNVSIPESISRCTRTVSVPLSPADARVRAKIHASEYSRWRRSGAAR